MTRQLGRPINMLNHYYFAGHLGCIERIFELLDWPVETVDENEIILEVVEM